MAAAVLGALGSVAVLMAGPSAAATPVRAADQMERFDVSAAVRPATAPISVRLSARALTRLADVTVGHFPAPQCSTCTRRG
jgi:hypothetical protein